MKRSVVTRSVFFFLTIAVAAAGVAAETPATSRDFELIIVRHAQTMANVTKDYSPENQQTFSEQGEREIARLAEKLRRLQIDHVVTSPTYRTLHTIATYLERERVVAEVWPEVEECCFQADRAAHSSGVIPPGDPIAIGTEIAGLFRFRDAESRRWYNAKTYADSERMAVRAAERLNERFGGSGGTVLLVTHFHTGAWIIAQLVGDEEARKIALGTAKLSRLRRDRDGSFRILSLNERPFDGTY